MTTITINQPKTKTEPIKVKGTFDITPYPWVPLILAGRYKEAEKMKAAYHARKAQV